MGAAESHPEATASCAPRSRSRAASTGATRIGKIKRIKRMEATKRMEAIPRRRSNACLGPAAGRPAPGRRWPPAGGGRPTPPGLFIVFNLLYRHFRFHLRFSASFGARRRRWPPAGGGRPRLPGLSILFCFSFFFSFSAHFGAHRRRGEKAASLCYEPHAGSQERKCERPEVFFKALQQAGGWRPTPPWPSRTWVRSHLRKKEKGRGRAAAASEPRYETARAESSASRPLAAELEKERKGERPRGCSGRTQVRDGQGGDRAPAARLLQSLRKKEKGRKRKKMVRGRAAAASEPMYEMTRAEFSASLRADCRAEPIVRKKRCSHLRLKKKTIV